jgi:DNA-binding protein HU-beta
MTKADLVDHVAAAVQLPKHQTEAVITRFLQAIMEALHAGDNVELRGFGSFWPRHRQARPGRNLRTGDPIQIPAKTVPAFTAGFFGETEKIWNMCDICTYSPSRIMEPMLLMGGSTPLRGKGF